jgi:hypothetical protein
MITFRADLSDEKEAGFCACCLARVAGELRASVTSAGVMEACSRRLQHQRPAVQEVQGVVAVLARRMRRVRRPFTLVCSGR